MAGTDYIGITNLSRDFPVPAVVSNSFTVTILTNGLIYTNFVEKYRESESDHLTTWLSGNATFGLSNAVLRLINPNFQGYLTLSATNYTGNESAGFISFVVNRVAGSAGTISVQYATTNGPRRPTAWITSARTNTLHWNNGDVSPRIVNIPLINTGTVGANKHSMFCCPIPTEWAVSAPSLFYVGTVPTGSITNATLTIINDNSYGAVQFSAPSYLVNENGGYATITVVRTGGTAGPDSVNFATSDGTASVSGVNYTTTSGTSHLCRQPDGRQLRCADSG